MRTKFCLDFNLDGFENYYSELQDLEAALIVEALRRTSGSKTGAAAMLGMNRTTLIEKMKRNPKLMDFIGCPWEPDTLQS